MFVTFVFFQCETCLWIFNKSKEAFVPEATRIPLLNSHEPPMAQDFLSLNQSLARGMMGLSLLSQLNEDHLWRWARSIVLSKTRIVLERRKEMKANTVYFLLPTYLSSYHTFSRLSFQQTLKKKVAHNHSCNSSIRLPSFEVSPTAIPPTMFLSVSPLTSLC